MVTAALLPTLLVVGSLMLVFGLRDAGLWHNLKVPAGRWRWPSRCWSAGAAQV